MNNRNDWNGKVYGYKESVMADIIQVDTALLGNDAIGIMDGLNNIKVAIQNMVEEIQELDIMWDGPANLVFMAQFENDISTFGEICKIIQQLSESMSHAKQEYEKCEMQVNSIIKSI